MPGCVAFESRQSDFAQHNTLGADLGQVVRKEWVNAIRQCRHTRRSRLNDHVANGVEERFQCKLSWIHDVMSHTQSSRRRMTHGGCVSCAAQHVCAIETMMRPCVSPPKKIYF